MIRKLFSFFVKKSQPPQPVLLLPAPEPKEQKMPTPPSVRTIARREGIDLGALLSILSYRRPYDTPGEEAFIEEFLDFIPNMQKDEIGNRYLRIGTAPVLWSCHTDTVHSDDGRQNLKWRGDTLELNNPQRGLCLGADDGAGMWLLLELIKAGKEGLYIFHRGEEVGRVGSKWIEKNTPDLLKDIQMAIAFDRRGTHSIITKQMGQRCCSDTFAKALGAELGPQFTTDPTGSYTDTATYMDMIPECTNVSVGYYDEHSCHETLDVAHLVRLRAALLELDTSKLPIERDPTEVEPYYDNWGYSGYNSGYPQYARQAPETDLTTITRLVERYPGLVAQMLIDLRYDSDTLCDELIRYAPPVQYDHDETEDHDMICNTCQVMFTSVYSNPCDGGEDCPECHSWDTECLYVYDN